MLTQLRPNFPVQTGDWKKDLHEFRAAQERWIDRLNEPGALAIRWDDLNAFHHMVNVRDWGAKGDGVTDDLAALNAAIASVNLRTEPTLLHFPPGIYLTSGTATAIARSHVLVHGENARVRCTAANKTIFTATKGSGGANTIENVNFSGLVLETSSTGTTGIGMLNVSNAHVSHCQFDGLSIGVTAATYDYCFVSDCVFDLNDTGIKASFGSGLFVNNCRLNGQDGASPVFATGSVGIDLEYAGGSLIQGADITRMEIGVRAVPPASATTAATLLVNTFMDSCDIGLQASTSGTGAVVQIQLANCGLGSCQTYGAEFEGVDIVMIDNTLVMNNLAEGLRFKDCTQVFVSDSFVSFNNVDNAANIPGILVDAVDGLYIRGNTFDNESGYPLAAASHQKHGIRFANTASSAVDITDNRFKNSVSDDISFAGTLPTDCVIRGNRTSKSSDVASAATITPAIVFDLVHITGTTTVTDITSSAIDGKIITLITDGACTITDTNTFDLAGSFIGVAGASITLQYNSDTSKWSEVCRAMGNAWATNFAPSGSSIPSGGNVMFAPAANTLGWSINGAEQMRVTANGLGIGRSPVASDMGVAVQSSGTTARYRLGNSSNANAADFAAVATDLFLYNLLNGTIQFGVNNAECGRFDASKNFLGKAAIRSDSPTGGVGYTTGAGGTQTQLTSKSTTVTLNAVCGEITMHNATLNANTTVSFTLTNSAVAATDIVDCVHASGGTVGSYLIHGRGTGAGSATITVRNITAGNLGEAIVIRFAVKKVVTS